MTHGENLPEWYIFVLVLDSFVISNYFEKMFQKSVMGWKKFENQLWALFVEIIRSKTLKFTKILMQGADRHCRKLQNLQKINFHEKCFKRYSAFQETLWTSLNFQAFLWTFQNSKKCDCFTYCTSPKGGKISEWMKRCRFPSLVKK